MASLNDIETKVHHIIDILDGRTIKTITGVLPLTFTTTEDKLRDWEIRGNDAVYEGQQGVGERTVNLFDGSTIQKGRIDNGTPGYAQDTTSATFVNGVISFTTIDNRYRGVYFDLIDIEGQFTCKVENKTGTAYLYFDYYDSEQTWISRGSANPSTFPFSITLTPPSNAKFLRFSIQNISIGDTSLTNVSFTKGSTAPSTYVPYGYEIPISVNGTPQTFYIGNTPLRAGQSISKTSTGVDIATTEGENTISTTLYNKPETSVTYAESGGVGEESSGSYSIPVKINSTTTNVPIGDTPLMEDEYVDYGEQKIYKRILFMTHDDKHFITKDNKDFCLRRRGYNG